MIISKERPTRILDYLLPSIRIVVYNVVCKINVFSIIRIINKIVYLT